MEIKRLNLEEIEKNKDEILKIYNESFGYTDGTMGEFLFERIKDSFNRDVNSIFLACFMKEKIVGFIYGFDFISENWFYKEIFDDVKDKIDFDNIFEFNEIAVDKNYRRKKIGTFLIETLMKNINAKKLIFCTDKENNKGAINFYKTLGSKVIVDNFYFKSFKSTAKLILTLDNN